MTGPAQTDPAASPEQPSPDDVRKGRRLATVLMAFGALTIVFAIVGGIIVSPFLFLLAAIGVFDYLLGRALAARIDER